MAGSGQSQLLRVAVAHLPDAAVVRVEGELDVATAPELERALADVLRAAPRRIVVDAEQLEFADVSGLRPLIALRDRLPRAAVLRVRNARPAVVRVIRLLDLADSLGLDG